METVSAVLLVLGFVLQVVGLPLANRPDLAPDTDGVLYNRLGSKRHRRLKATGKWLVSSGLLLATAGGIVALPTIQHLLGLS